MHLLAGDIGSIDDGNAAVDLDQPPGDIVVLSAADSELAALSAAAVRRGPNAPSVRFANLARLAHPLSVDLYVEKTLAHARLVIVRMMGGVGYWPYGLERLRALARAGGPALAVMPGEDRWDDALEAYATVGTEECRRLWRYLVEGGAGNVAHALDFMAHLIGRGAAPPPPETLAHAGYYRPGEGAVAFRALDLAADRPVAAIVFYRALLDGGSTGPIDALVAALAEEGIASLPVFVASLKDRESEAFLADAFERTPPAIVLNTTSFAVSKVGAAHEGTILDAPGRPVLQVILAGSSEQNWRDSPRGLLPRDLTMNVVLPEVDGRLLTRAVSFKAETVDRGGLTVTTYRAVADRVAFVAKQAAAWVRLAHKPAKDRRVAIVLSNYPNRDGRLANGVGLDTPASAVALAEAMAGAGYEVAGFPKTSAALMALLLSGQANAMAPPKGALPLPGGERAFPLGEPRVSLEEKGEGPQAPPDGSGAPSPQPSPLRGEGVVAPCTSHISLCLADYAASLVTIPATLRDALAARWGAPEADPFFADGAFRLAIHRFGNVVIGIQPARGYNIDPKATYHDPALVPPHHYLAFYAWLRNTFAADAVVQLGKHGNLEWLPGKALGLSEHCWPEVALGTLPLVYPFIVNDPGEGSQAKRRSSAVIVDHLMPAMTRAETYGGLAELETLIDEYYLAAGVDERRRAWLEGEIIAAGERTGIARDLGLKRADRDGSLRALDAHLCEIKELQIRDGLHTLGGGPAGRQRIDTLAAIARVPRSGGRPEDQSLHRAIAEDLALGFDPLDCDMAEPWIGPRPGALAVLSDAPWRSAGDTVERIELFASALVADTVTKGAAPSPQPSPRRGEGEAFLPGADSPTRAVLAWIADNLAPSLDRSGPHEIASVLAALDGRFVPPGPSGAPTRGRPDVLPTGRNFYSVDVRAVPTAAAWAIGRAAADALALRYFQDEGEWPRSIAMSAWGTSNMRTGGDDVAQVLALIGAAPTWEPGTGRVTGFRVLSLADLGRPRIDVTLKISGMFRDAFPGQLDLIDSAVRAIAALSEDEAANPIAAAAGARLRSLLAAGLPADLAERQATARIFGARPGTYGTGMQALIDEDLWEQRSDFARTFVEWGGFAYGGGKEGEAAHDAFAARLETVEAVLHNQDNREHDLLDSDDYSQFQGGFIAAVQRFRNIAPRSYNGDNSRPEKPVVRPLAEEIGSVVRGRAANPKWIAGMMRHGYKGAFEIAATVDHLFAYAATTDAVGDHHFDELYQAYIEDEAVREFMAEANPAALAEMAERFRRAIDRGLWSPRRNSVYDRLSALISERAEAAE